MYVSACCIFRIDRIFTRLLCGDTGLLGVYFRYLVGSAVPFPQTVLSRDGECVKKAGSEIPVGRTDAVVVSFGGQAVQILNPKVK